jgi:hydroxymethylpyrimidine pyrophosphatase-like HAD family hydrolase
MLAWAGRSFAMARADPALDGVVTDRTADNDEDGVARALEELFGL